MQSRLSLFVHFRRVSKAKNCDRDQRGTLIDRMNKCTVIFFLLPFSDQWEILIHRRENDSNKFEQFLKYRNSNKRLYFIYEISIYVDKIQIIE